MIIDAEKKPVSIRQAAMRQKLPAEFETMKREKDLFDEGLLAQAERRLIFYSWLE